MIRVTNLYAVLHKTESLKINKLTKFRLYTNFLSSTLTEKLIREHINKLDSKPFTTFTIDYRYSTGEYRPHLVRFKVKASRIRRPIIREKRRTINLSSYRPDVDYFLSFYAHGKDISTKEELKLMIAPLIQRITQPVRNIKLENADTMLDVIERVDLLSMLAEHRYTIKVEPKSIPKIEVASLIISDIVSKLQFEVLQRQPLITTKVDLKGNYNNENARRQIGLTSQFNTINCFRFIDYKTEDCSIFDLVDELFPSLEYMQEYDKIMLQHEPYNSRLREDYQRVSRYKSVKTYDNTSTDEQIYELREIIKILTNAQDHLTYEQIYELREIIFDNTVVSTRVRVIIPHNLNGFNSLRYKFSELVNKLETVIVNTNVPKLYIQVLKLFIRINPITGILLLAHLNRINPLIISDNLDRDGQIKVVKFWFDFKPQILLELYLIQTDRVRFKHESELEDELEKEDSKQIRYYLPLRANIAIFTR